ncbi:MAG: hypothetical protein ACFFDF_20925, partial [Candidatus Odinarchaeota archaeon]
MNLFKTEIRKKHKIGNLKLLICLIFTFTFLLNFLFITNIDQNINYSEDNFNTNYNNFDNNSNIKDLKPNSVISLLQDPFTKNFEQIRQFFDNKYQSNLGFAIPTYYRYGDTNGVITDNSIFSEDNLLYYKSFKQFELSNYETFETYLDLKDTSLWYQGNVEEYRYGFINSINGTNGEIKDDNRFLIDNIMPIFLLIENIGSEINNIVIRGTLPRISINEMFYLINSSQFWDNRITYNGFFNYNSSNTKYAESNFYAILANLLIHRSYQQLGLEPAIRNRALELANLTIIDMVDNGYMWDSTEKAFYHDANNDWDTSLAGQKYYYLGTNALGIITLLEFWIESGMKSDSIYYQDAINLYKSLEYLYDNGLYQKIALPTWSAVFDSSKDLKDNALMMRACLKLFEVTGNITYYNRALTLYNSIENNLYDSVNTSYDFSLTNSAKSFNSNLKLGEAYLDAFMIYNSTIINAAYNVSGEIPDFVFNQDKLNLSLSYSFKRTGQYFNPGNSTFRDYTIKYDITNYTINYVFKFPNGTYFYKNESYIGEPETSYTLLYDIQDTLTISDGYYIYIWANTTYFKLTDTLKQFNVTSGLITDSIFGLPRILYHGPIVNVSLNINYTRTDDSLLNASLEGQDIVIYPSQEINFIAFQQVQIDFNLTAKF